MDKIVQYIKYNYKKVIIGAVVTILIVWQMFGSSSGSESEIYEVTLGNVRSEVAVTGRVKPVSEVSMAFERTGRIAGVRKNVGDRVYRGELIANLDLSSPLAKLNQERATLDQLKRGSRPEEIAVKEAEVQKAESDLKGEYDSVFDTLNDAFVKSEDAVRLKVASIFLGSSVVGYRLAFNSCDTTTEESAKSSFAKSEVVLSKWRAEISGLELVDDTTKIDMSLRSGIDSVIIFRNMLRDLSSLLNQQCAFENTGLDDYREDVSSANGSIAIALTNLIEKQRSINTYKATLRKVDSDLSLLKAGTDPEEIRVQMAKVNEAQASLLTYEIISPINGIVTKQDAKGGEIAYANTELVSVISDGAFEIEVNVPELDITTIKKGDTAKITFDAYGESAVFEGVVSSVDPAETIVDNVPTYKIKVTLQSTDTRIKSGLTANVYINTESKENVPIIPARAVKSISGKKIVTLVDENNSTREVEVTLGIRGSTGEIEVISGLVVGEKILISNASAKK